MPWPNSELSFQYFLQVYYVLTENDGNFRTKRKFFSAFGFSQSDSNYETMQEWLFWKYDLNGCIPTFKK